MSEFTLSDGVMGAVECAMRERGDLGAEPAGTVIDYRNLPERDRLLIEAACRVQDAEARAAQRREDAETDRADDPPRPLQILPKEVPAELVLQLAGRGDALMQWCSKRPLPNPAESVDVWCIAATLQVVSRRVGPDKLGPIILATISAVYRCAMDRPTDAELEGQQDAR